MEKGHLIRNFIFAFCSLVLGLGHFPVALAAEFSDADLKMILKNQAKAKDLTVLLYTWSPHMVLSIRGLDELLQFEKNKKIIAILDPNANIRLAEKIAKEHHWPEEVLRINISQDLINLGLRVHYPTYLFLAQGKVQGRAIPGYKTAKELAYFSKRFLP